MAEKVCFIRKDRNYTGSILRGRKEKLLWRGERRSFSILNQLLSGHTRLNNHRAKIDKTASRMCDTCKVLENTEHYLCHFDAYQEERDTLEKTVEEVLYREGLNTVSDITLKVLNGSIDGISPQGQTDLIGALIQYIKSTKRF